MFSVGIAHSLVLLIAGICHKTGVCGFLITRYDILRCETFLLSVFKQVELGAGDTHGPFLGMKIFRNLTPRLYA